MRVLLGRDLIQRADPDRGRFRHYLLGALKKFLIDEHRRVAGRGATPRPALVPTDPTLLAAVEPCEQSGAGDAFDERWAEVLFETALERMSHECQTNGLQRHWHAFEARYVRPTRNGKPSPSLQELTTQLAANSPAQVEDLLRTARRKFQQIFRATVAETVDPADLDEEIRFVEDLLFRDH